MRISKMKLFKQYKVGNTWGYLLQVASQGSVVTQIVMISIQVITLASVLQLRGIMVPVWLIGLLAFSIVGTAGILIFKLGNPSYFAALNEQAYKHDNPIRKDLEDVKKTLAEIQEKLSQYEKGN